MQFIPGTCGRLLRFCCLAVFVQFTIVAAVSQASPDGQQADATAPEPPPPPAAFKNPIPGVQLAFLTGFDGHPANDLMKDKRFKELMKNEIPRTEYHYGRDMSLNDALGYAIDGSPLPVEVRDGRFLMAAGQQGRYLSGRGFVWIDLQAGIFQGGFFFTRSTASLRLRLRFFHGSCSRRTCR